MKYRDKVAKIKLLYTELQEPLKRSVPEICSDIGIGRATFYEWKAKLKASGVDNIIEPEPGKTIFIPMRMDSKDPVDTYNKFIDIQLIRDFTRQCRLNKKNPALSHLFRICNAANMTPDEITTDLNSAKEAFLLFDELYHKNDSTLTNERYRKALRTLLQFAGINIPNKDPLIGGGSDSNGDYATVSLTPVEVQQVAEYVGDKLGERYEDIFRIHHEAFPRPQTMHNWTPRMEVKHVDVDGRSLAFVETSVFENKQHKHYNKLLLDPKAINSFQKYIGKKIVEIPFRDFITEYSSVLRNAYLNIGKIVEGQKYAKGNEGWLWSNKPIYSIRHSAAVQWINRTNFDVNLVATMGWEKTDTLTKYYARISTNNIMQKGICYYCSPPSITGSQPVFCSAPHSLAYIHGMRRNN
jgi:hypothetical protein